MAEARSARPLSAIVLAAGEGTRMRSARPKPLHVLCGRPMVLHILDALSELPLERAVVVVGHGAERVTKTLQEQIASEMPIEFVEQRVQRGTGDATSVALTASGFDDDGEDDIRQGRRLCRRAAGGRAQLHERRACLRHGVVHGEGRPGLEQVAPHRGAHAAAPEQSHVTAQWSAAQWSDHRLRDP
jgi:hypothetical protein